MSINGWTSTGGRNGGGANGGVVSKPLNDTRRGQTPTPIGVARRIFRDRPPPTVEPHGKYDDARLSLLNGGISAVAFFAQQNRARNPQMVTGEPEWIGGLSVGAFES